MRRIASQTLQIEISIEKIDPYPLKDWSLVVNKTKFSTNTKKDRSSEHQWSIIGEKINLGRIFHFKDRSFYFNDRSMHFYNWIFEILEIWNLNFYAKDWSSRFILQHNISKTWFVEEKEPKMILGLKRGFSSWFLRWISTFRLF